MHHPERTSSSVSQHRELVGTTAEDPIVVLGFGRSGTTWIADIISRTMGKLILFEHFHPSVTPHSREISYGPLHAGSEPLARDLISDVLSGRNRKPWLLRNHIPVDLDSAPPGLTDMVWRECDVAGFKEIRANFQVAWLGEHVSHRIAFVIRHPYGVISSIKRRPNFWEFGWPGTFDLMMSNTVFSPVYEGTPVAGLRDQAREASTDAERIALMWTATHLDALPALRELGLTAHDYSDFLATPFRASRKLLASLGVDGEVHPSYLFSPSMTAEISAVARHGLVDEGDIATPRQGPVSLTPRERSAIDRITAPVADLVDLGHFAEADSLSG